MVPIQYVRSGATTRAQCWHGCECTLTLVRLLPVSSSSTTATTGEETASASRTATPVVEVTGKERGRDGKEEEKEEKGKENKENERKVNGDQYVRAGVTARAHSWHGCEYTPTLVRLLPVAANNS